MAEMKIGDNFDVELAMDASVGNPGEGIHKAKCTDARIKENKARDGHNLELDFEITAGEDKGKTTRAWISLKETARWKLTEVIKAFGVEFDHDKNGKPKARLKRKMFVGKKVRLHIVMQDVNGEERASIERILEPRTDERPKGASSSAKARKPQKSKPEPEPEDADEDDEDEGEDSEDGGSGEDSQDDDDDSDDDSDDDDDELPPEEELPF